MVYRWELILKAVNVVHRFLQWPLFFFLPFFLFHSNFRTVLFFITSHFSFHSAVGLQMSSGSSVSTVRSDCPSSVTKFGEEILAPLCWFLFSFILFFCFTCDFAVLFLTTRHSSQSKNLSSGSVLHVALVCLHCEHVHQLHKRR